MAAVIIVNHQFHAQTDVNFSPFAYGLQDGLSRVVWSIATCYIIFACIHDLSGPLNWFLSHPLWQPLARLSFATYIVHRPITLYSLGTMKTPPVASEAMLCSTAMLNYILSIFVAILATLAFESPIINLEKVFFGSHLKNRPSVANKVQKQNTQKLNDKID